MLHVSIANTPKDKCKNGFKRFIASAGSNIFDRQPNEVGQAMLLMVL
jgi:hypothetical protein